MSMCISTAQARTKRVSRNSVRQVLVKCPCAFRLRRFAQNSGPEISVWHFSRKFPHTMALVKCPCAFRLRRLAQNEASHIEILPRDLLSGACTEILPRDLCKRFVQRDRDLVQRSCQETSFGDLVQRPGEESEVLLGDLTLRSLTKIFCGDLIKTPGTDSLTQGSCTAASTENLSRRSCARSSTEIFAKGTCRFWPCIVSLLFTTRVALVLLACSHWWFWVLSTLLFTILTTQCLGSLARKIELFIFLFLFAYVNVNI